MWSDHFPFRKLGLPAIMITDTAPFRNPNYHELTDVLARIDTRPMARVVLGLMHVVAELAGRPDAG